MDKEQIIAEIRKRHQVGLSPTDPVFALLTANELLMNQYVEHLSVMLEQESAKLEVKYKEHAEQAQLLMVAQANEVIKVQNAQFEEACEKLRKSVQPVPVQQPVSPKLQAHPFSDSYVIFSNTLIAAVCFLMGLAFKAFIWK